MQAAAAGSCGAGVEHLSINRLQQCIPPCLPFCSSCHIVDRLFTLSNSDVREEDAITVAVNRDIVNVTYVISRANGARLVVRGLVTINI